jgi:N-acetyl-D-muramate 6-phosphate phosphatase
VSASNDSAVARGARERACRAVLFDFDGTLADTAPDLGAAVNHLRSEKGLPPLSADAVRPYASMGARGLLRVGFGLTPQDAEYPPLRDAFLARYGEHLCVHTSVFPGIVELLEKLKAMNILWGVVTNKATRFTQRIVEALSLRPDCVICGDSTPHLKPHPASLLLAAKQLDLAPRDCVYLGDDLRDIQAARAAGMRSVAVTWGYHSPDNDGPPSWNADALVHQPRELIHHLEAQ